MSSSTESLLAASVCGLKEALVRGRAEAAAAHRAGASGREVCARLRELCDLTIATAYQELLQRSLPAARPEIERDLAVVAVGGYGRGDLAPYSDIDLLMLTVDKPSAVTRTFISDLLRDLWDIGLKVSHGVRSAAESLSLANQDLPARTAILETRHLAGQAELYGTFRLRVTRYCLASTSLGRFISACLAERSKEHEDYYAPTVCLLEPNVKKSPGGLRDQHLFRWVATARYGTADALMLIDRGLLSSVDATAMDAATEFLLRIRNELHFKAGSAQDVLTRDEQVRMAGWMGFVDAGALLAVERFMQHYYRQTTALHDAVMRFTDRSGTRPMLRRFADRLLTRRANGSFLIGGGQVAIQPEARVKVLADGCKLLELFDLARTHGSAIVAEDLESVRVAAASCPVDTAVRRRFLEMLANPQRLGELLRALQRAGLLARLVPAFEHAQCLIQFNLAHKYTLDEHSIRAVEAAAGQASQRGPVASAYRETHRKDLLHLALLCHDLGKGHDGDHCEVGRKIAEETAALFGLSAHERDVLVFLIHRHLIMAHTAFRRDTSDDATLVQFAREVATPEALRLLYVHTAADTEAVSPGNFTAWKEALLTELYYRAMEELAGEEPSGDADPTNGAGASARHAALESLRRELFDALHVRLPMQWLQDQLAAMPASYLRRTAPERVADHLAVLKDMQPGDVHVDHEYLPATSLTRLTVMTQDDLVPGIFSKVAGVLAAANIDVIAAQIITRPDGLLIDTFEGLDGDYTGEPPSHRREQLAGNIRDVLFGRRTVESLFTQRIATNRSQPDIRPAPPRVEIDNDSSAQFSIVEVFATDRRGLLYDITRTLFELGLSVSSARISTHIDQIVDAFYVTTLEGEKLKDEAAQDAVRARLLLVLLAE